METNSGKIQKRRDLYNDEKKSLIELVQKKCDYLNLLISEGFFHEPGYIGTTPAYVLLRYVKKHNSYMPKMTAINRLAMQRSKTK